MIDARGLNPFEIKAEIAKIFETLKGVNDFENYAVNLRTLDSLNDKKIIVKLLFKEINNTNHNAGLLKFLLLRYCTKDELTEHLWNIIKSSITSNQAKIFALDLLRDIDTDWSYEECGKYLDNPDELIDSDTKRILDNAIVNPEVQIDFLDFLSSLGEDDRIVLLKSLGADYDKDELANLLVPVFLSMPYTQTGKTALEILGNSKSQLAYHALNSALEFAQDNLVSSIKKNLSVLKLAGIREDNSHEFYKNLLKNSKPYKFCITYPDGHGNQAVIFTREKADERIQFVAVVLDDYNGIKDCFGFNDISKFECEKIIERFCQDEAVLNISPEALKTILLNAEKLNSKFPYEYICWKNLLADIEINNTNIQEILETNLKASEISAEDLKSLCTDEFTQHWFLEYSYSDEFDEMIDVLNTRLLNNDYKIDFDKIINLYLNTIFYPEENKIWSERLLITAYLKLLTNQINTAEKIYGLYLNADLKDEFLKNILRKSIYEYYFSLKYNTELNNGKFSLNELDYIIKLIESRWVQNV